MLAVAGQQWRASPPAPAPQALPGARPRPPLAARAVPAGPGRVPGQQRHLVGARRNRARAAPRPGAAAPAGKGRSPRGARAQRLGGRAPTDAPCPLPWPGTNEPPSVISQQKDRGRLLPGYIRGDHLLLRGFLGASAAALHKFLLGCWGLIKI